MIQAKVQILTGEIYPLDLDLKLTDNVAALISLVMANLTTASAKEGKTYGRISLDELKLYYKNRPLIDYNLTLEQAGLTDSVELLALKPRVEPPPTLASPPFSISRELIDQATQHFPKPSSRGRTSSRGAGGGSKIWGLKLRALISTLAHIGTAIQSQEGTGEEEAEGAGENAEEGDALGVDEESLQQLVSMGFPEEPAKKALLLNRMSPILAMDWLLEAGEASLNTPLSPPELEKIKKRKNTFKANPVNVAQLQSMGFNKHDIYVALRASRNDLESACTWLLGDRGSMVINLDDDEPSDLLPMDDPHIQALLANPRVQAGFSNPRVVAAFQALAVNPANAQRYLTDGEIAPVLLAITQTLQMKVLSLYRSLLRASRGFPSYNHRLYALDRVKYGFHENQGEKDPKKIEELVKMAEDSLLLVRRQVSLGKMYATERLVIEQAV